MVCKYCGGEVDDPFWDDACRECEHEMEHSGYCDPNCQECLWDSEDRYEQGMEQLPDIGEAYATDYVTQSEGENMEINVSQDDIDAASRWSLTECPIGHAWSRIGVHAEINWWPLIGGVINTGTGWRRLPRELRWFPAKFDLFGPRAVRPTS